MKKNNSKLLVILNLVSLVCGVIALILLFNGNVGFDNPIIWVLCGIVLSSISALGTQFFNKK